MPIKDWHKTSIDSFLVEFEGESDAFLFKIAELWKDKNAGIAAKSILDNRKNAEDKEKHGSLISAVSTPHWSTVPAFWLLVISASLSLIAAVASVLALPQVQKLFAQEQLPPVSIKEIQKPQLRQQESLQSQKHKP